MPTATPNRPPADAALLRRLERSAAWFVVAATVVGAALGGLSWAGGILAGGLLAAISYWAIRSSVDALVTLLSPAARGTGPAPPPAAPSPARLAFTVLGRHALLGIVAYVIIARLRLHPVSRSAADA